ncbi:MAG: NADPH-dependent glutamate synthase [Anaerolineaceae bacterium]|nr:NADPH-dependent glutamate synthase [Anaerolineaceae bacterium]
MNKLPLKERMKIERHPMPTQLPGERVKNFDEVNLGYSLQIAQKEAQRCLQCKDAPCTKGCPVHVHIPEFLSHIIEGDLLKAADVILNDNFLPSICGRVCPQETLCESRCVLAKKGKPVAIGNLERFTADFTTDLRLKREMEGIAEPTGKKVAMIGSGPSSLACAGDLARFGHAVTVFEALHAFGGVLVFGIPEFRLPKSTVNYEIDVLRRLGVRFEKDIVIGRTLTLNELMTEEGYDAVFIGAGAGLPHFLGIPGEELIGIYSSNELLTRINLMKAYQKESETPVLSFQDKVVGVFGAGNTALDSARTALRMGAKEVFIIYRRSEEEMPARKEEVRHAREEGVEFIFLASPLEFIGNQDGWLTSVRLQRMKLGELDDSGRRRPLPIEGSEFMMEIERAVIAIGNGTNPLLRDSPGLEFTKRGTLVVNEDTLETTKRGVFAGGDIVTGGATVISAMGAGRKAAQSIQAYLSK